MKCLCETRRKIGKYHSTIMNKCSVHIIHKMKVKLNPSVLMFKKNASLYHSEIGHNVKQKIIIENQCT